MKIGLDARTIQGHFTGDSTYWRGLIEGLARSGSAHEFIIYLSESLPKPDLPESENIRPRFLCAPSSRVWSAWTFPRALRTDAVDLAHVQYTIPPVMPCPVVTTIHDVSFKRHPEFFSMKDRLILDAGVKRATHRAARIIAVSEYTKKEICELYKISPEKIAVVYSGADSQYKPINPKFAYQLARDKYDIGTAFVLTVGVIQPRKNLPRLLEGFSLFKAKGHIGHKLVIVGKYGWKESNLRMKITQLGLKDDVVLTGYVPYEDLPALYGAADVFVYPSVYEGFGLPVLEAMACGTPVITGNFSSLPEVVGDAGLMVDPHDPRAFAEAMEKVLTNEILHTDMSARSLSQAANFTWDNTARDMLAIYEEAVGIL